MPTSQTTCKCTKGPTGHTLDPASGMWVHVVCRLPSPAELARVLQSLL